MSQHVLKITKQISNAYRRKRQEKEEEEANAAKLRPAEYQGPTFLELPMLTLQGSSSERVVEREMEVNVMLRAAIDYAHRPTLAPKSTYARKYNEQSYRVFQLAHTCMSSAALISLGVRDLSRSVQRSAPNSPSASTAPFTPVLPSLSKAS